MKDYTRHMDFMNFVVGLDYQDSDSVFSLEPFNDSNDTKFVSPDKVEGNLSLGRPPAMCRDGRWQGVPLYGGVPD